jgi:hypothetical protein
MMDQASAARASKYTGHAATSGSTYVSYNFENDGGAVGDVNLDGVIPNNAIITDIITYVDTPLTSDGAATVAANLVDPNGVAADIPALADTAFGAIANAIAHPDVFTTAGMEARLTISAAALTAGILTFKICYEVMA